MSEVLPLYECHKRVRAAKIVDARDLTGDRAGLLLTLDVPTPDGGATLVAREVGYSFMPPRAVVSGLSALVGGYFVEYADGYVSWSPAKAFEEGYQLLRENG